MDDIVTFADEVPPPKSPTQSAWKILIADDDPAVHLVTKLALGEFTLEGRRLELLSAYGEDDTRRLLEEHPDIALILLDVVMDTMDSGFTLVRYIRETLQNKDVRIIMRTGQSGNAPEDRIIISYDINDFKDKTELTVAKLRTTMISSLRTYNHLKIIAEEQQKSSASRAYLHSIIDSLSSVLITLDFDFQVLLWNREAERWTGISADEARGHTLFEVAPVFEPLKALLQSLKGRATGGRIERTSVPMWRNGQVFVHLILQSLSGSNGPEILLRLDDRTIAKQQNDQILRSQKVNAFSALAAGVAGELAEVLHSNDPDSVERIRAWGVRASGLLDRLAQFSPLALPDRQAQDWSALVRRKAEALTAPPGVTLSFRAPGTPAWVGAHPGGLDTMVDNLLENALDAMTSAPGVEKLEGPRVVDVTLDQEVLSEDQRTKHPEVTPGPYWVLTVQDHGVGMTAEVANQVFDPYFTTKPRGQGLGLGLPLVYSLAEGLGGFVDLTSRPGLGTAVRVFLPGWTGSAEGGGRREAVLLCEDDALLRQVTARILRNHGFEVLEAMDGTGALEVFQGNRDRIRLAVLDLILPGIPGFEVFRAIHDRAPSIPVILTSGFGRSEAVDRAVAEGLSSFLQKPYRAEELITAIDHALGGRAGQESG